MNNELFLMQATREQLNKINKFLDSALKLDGIKALADVVDIYNVVAGAVRMQEAEDQEGLAQTLKSSPLTDEERRVLNEVETQESVNG